MAVELLLATDFDGTIAAIRETPDEASVDPAIHEILSSLNDRSDIAVAIISGRDLADLEARTAGIRAYRSGSHGHEISLPNGERVRSAPQWKGTPDREWIRRAIELGFRPEPKKYGLALHWRGLDGVADDHPILREFVAWARGELLEVSPGRFVLEAGIPGARKENVLAELMKRTEASRVVYAGNDLTDFAALEWASERGRAFFLQTPERLEIPVGRVEVLGSRLELIDRWREEIGRTAKDHLSSS